MSTSIGTAVVGDPRLKKLRAMQMLEMRLKSHTLQEIADEFRVSIDTVQRHLDWAVREGAIQKHEESILERLVPKAIKAYEKALDADTPDIFVAKDILSHLMKLSERIEKRTEHVEELSLTAWLKTRKATDVGRHDASGARGNDVPGALPVVEVRAEDVRPGEADAGSQDATGAAREDPFRPAGHGDREVPRHAAAGPAEVGPPIDGELVSTEPASAGRADGEASLDAIDTEVVVAP